MTAALVDIASQYPEAEGRLIERAYVFAQYWHRDRLRRSGDPYITHSLSVAAVLAGLGMDAATVCAGLLHEVTPTCPIDRIRAEFGAEIAGLVATLVELDHGGSVAAAERRAQIVRLADRLHNMQTIRWLDRDNQEQKSRNTLAILVPLAGELGLDAIRRQLEDISLATLYRGSFTGHSGHLADLRVSRRVLAAFATLLPARDRARWLEEWLGELHALPGRRARARFTMQLVAGMSRFAIVLHRKAVP